LADAQVGSNHHSATGGSTGHHDMGCGMWNMLQLIGRRCRCIAGGVWTGWLLIHVYYICGLNHTIY